MMLDEAIGVPIIFPSKPSRDDRKARQIVTHEDEFEYE